MALTREKNDRAEYYFDGEMSNGSTGLSGNYKIDCRKRYLNITLMVGCFIEVAFHFTELSISNTVQNQAWS
jgi:hypothetical protein